MLFGGKKERQTEELIRRHAEVVGQVVGAMHRAATDYCGERPDFEKHAEAVMKGESEADEVRREVEQSLYDGAFMPIERGDYARLIERVDKVANQCEAVAQFMLLTRPICNPDVQRGLSEIMDVTVDCYAHVIKMFESFDEGRTVMEHANWIEVDERKVDKIFATVVSELFASKEDLARKIHVKMLFDRAAAISNRIEDASDVFSIIVSKRPT